MTIIDDSKPSNTFDLQQLKTAWTLYGAEAKGESAHNAKLIVNTAYLEISGNKVVINVENFVQQRQLVELRDEITLYLREKLNNYAIQIDSVLKKEIKGDKTAFTSQEKFILLSKENPALLQLKEILQLEAGH